MNVRFVSRLVGAAALTVAAAGLGCSSTPETEESVTVTGSEFRESPATPGSSSTMSGEEGKILEMQTVYFAFDSSEIRSDARQALRGNADKLNSTVTGTVTIQGNTDERGSEEYNYALGERRANAVKRYLVDLGIPSSRLRTVSFGESRPAVQGHDESAWRYNRRADFAR